MVGFGVAAGAQGGSQLGQAGVGHLFGFQAFEVLGQVFGFVQRQQRLYHAQPLQGAGHAGVAAARRRLGLPRQPPKLAQEVLGQLRVAGGQHDVFLVGVGRPVGPVVGAGQHVAPVEDAELVVHQPVFHHAHPPAGRLQFGKGQAAGLEINVLFVAGEAQRNGHPRPLPLQQRGE